MQTTLKRRGLRLSHPRGSSVVVFTERETYTSWKKTLASAAPNVALCKFASALCCRTWLIANMIPSGSPS